MRVVGAGRDPPLRQRAERYLSTKLLYRDPPLRQRDKFQIKSINHQNKKCQIITTPKSTIADQCDYKDYDYSQNGYYFVTICTKNKAEHFGKIINGEMILNEYGKIVKQQ